MAEIGGIKFTLFSERKALGDEFAKWAAKNGVLVCGESVISWLETQELLNVDKAIELAKELKKKGEKEET